jgi:hypothetical protein
MSPPKSNSGALSTINTISTLVKDNPLLIQIGAGILSKWFARKESSVKTDLLRTYDDLARIDLVNITTTQLKTAYKDLLKLKKDIEVTINEIPRNGLVGPEKIEALKPIQEERKLLSDRLSSMPNSTPEDKKRRTEVIDEITVLTKQFNNELVDQRNTLAEYRQQLVQLKTALDDLSIAFKETLEDRENSLRIAEEAKKDMARSPKARPVILSGPVTAWSDGNPLATSAEESAEASKWPQPDPTVLETFNQQLRRKIMNDNSPNYDSYEPRERPRRDSYPGSTFFNKTQRHLERSAQEREAIGAMERRSFVGKVLGFIFFGIAGVMFTSSGAPSGLFNLLAPAIPLLNASTGWLLRILCIDGPLIAVKYLKGKTGHFIRFEVPAEIGITLLAFSTILLIRKIWSFMFYFQRKNELSLLERVKRTQGERELVEKSDMLRKQLRNNLEEELDNVNNQ